MISTTRHKAAYFTAPVDLRDRARTLATHAAKLCWNCATQVLRLTAISLAVIALAPVGLTMWFASEMQRGREFVFPPY